MKRMDGHNDETIKVPKGSILLKTTKPPSSYQTSRITNTDNYTP